MRLQLSVICLILNFVIYSLTDNNGLDDSRYYYRKLYEKAILRPTTSEITNAISDSNVSRKIQVERLQQFFYVGKYTASFIQLLNKYKTLSYKPIELSTGEITTLTSNYDDGSKHNRILTQFKFYRKVQEIQCTSYFLIKFILPKVESYLTVIADYVYNMIEMSYKGKFVVSTWLWKLHIKLLGVQHSTLKPQTFLKEHLPEINGTLRKLIRSCRKNKYLKKKLNYYTSKDEYILLLKTFLGKYEYDEKYEIFFDNPYKLPVSIDYLLLYSMWKSARGLFYDIAGLAFKWDNTYDLITKEIKNIENQYQKGEWTLQPFKYIKYHEIVLDVLKAKLYGYIWIHLAFYLKTGIMAQHKHNEFIRRLYHVLLFAYTEDQVLAEVLILLSEIYEPDDEKINKTIKILSVEVNAIMSNYTERKYWYQEAEIDYEYIQRNYETDFKFLERHGSNFERFFREIEGKLGRLKLSLLLFYINGKIDANFVFPNK